MNTNEWKDRCLRLMGFVESAPVESGVCVCGDSMNNHPSAYACGHEPCDMWLDNVMSWREEINLAVKKEELQSNCNSTETAIQTPAVGSIWSYGDEDKIVWVVMITKTDDHIEVAFRDEQYLMHSVPLDVWAQHTCWNSSQKQ